MDLKTAIKPLHSLYKIFGLVIYNIDTKSKRNIFLSNKNIFIYISQLLLYFALITLSATYKIIYIDKIDFKHTWFSNYYYLSASLLDISVSVIYMLISLLKEKEMRSIYNKICELNLITNYSKIYTYVKIQLLIFIILFPMLISLSIRAGSFLNAIAPIIISVGPFARDYLTFTQFSNLMLILSQHFSILNENTLNDKSFKEWCKIYHKLYGIAKLINSTFGLHMMFSVILRLCWIISNGYDVVMILSKNSKYSNATLEETYVYFPWLFIDVTTLLTIIFICNNVKIKARQYIKILSRYTSQQNLTTYNMWSLKNIDKEIQFTGNGLFNMDFNFIISSLGTMTYYIFILTQLER